MVALDWTTYYLYLFRLTAWRRI